MRLSVSRLLNSDGSSRLPRLLTRPMAALVALLVVVAGLVGIPFAPADAAGVIGLSATSTGSVLSGAQATVTLKASNSTTTNEYNLAFRYQLPNGVTYVTGSSPTGVGDPTIITVTDSAGPPAVTHQVLVWKNVSDLAPDDTSTLTFTVQPDATAKPVNSTFQGTADVYGNTDARTIPSFDGTGTATASTYTDTAEATTNTTQISALKVTKAEPSPETELMRGVHAHPTVYTIVVSNTSMAPTSGVTVVDYLPAGLEFLQCGAVDNSAAGTVEYPGSPRLDAAPVASGITAATCLTPASVETVSNPTGQPAGVYTKVTWNLGTVSATPITINYEAAVPLRANTMTFSGATPTIASDQQSANLDNNNGAITRQINGASTDVNTVTATGTYTGAVAAGTSTTTTATDSATIKASDLSIVKTTDPSFVGGTLSAYNLMVRASEYVSDNAMTIVDTLPNGLCPVVPAGTSYTGDTLPAECSPSATSPSVVGAVSNATVTSVNYTASTGVFVMTLQPSADVLAANGTVNIGYNVLMRTTYSGSGAPTAAGDAFTNHVTIAGTSTVVAATGQTPTTEPVTDDSSATKSTSGPSISKKVLPRTNVSDAAGCAAQVTASGDPYIAATSATGPIFQLGDRVCFELTVNYSRSTKTRNSLVTDMLPPGSTYESYAVGNTASGDTVPAAQVVATQTQSSMAQWKIGATTGTGTDVFVPAASKAVIYVSAIIGAAGATATKPDLADNLMKYSQANTANSALSLRDDAGYRVAPAPQLTLDKSIVSNSVSGDLAAPGATSVAREGANIGFQINVANVGTAAIGNNVEAQNVTVWDALPARVTCAAVSVISASGTCSDTPPTTLNSVAGNVSVIIWNSLDIQASSTGTVTYTVTVPQGVSVSSSLVNRASVVSFTSPNTAGGSAQYYPATSLDTAGSAKANALTANDYTTTLTAPAATVTKTAVTPVPNAYNTSAQVVAGETITSYTYSATVPAQTTLYQGVLTDPLPATVIPTSSTAYSVLLPDNSSPTLTFTPATGSPRSATFQYLGQTYTLSINGQTTTLTFPTTFDNYSSTGAGAAATFQVVASNLVVAATVLPAATVKNTATLTSKVSAASGAAAAPSPAASATLKVIAPAPTLTKTASMTSGVSVGSPVAFTLTAGNASTATTSTSTTAYDTIVVDCLPASFTFVGYGSTLPAGVTTLTPAAGDQAAAPAAPSTACATGTTRVGYTIANTSPLNPGGSVAVVINATVASTASASTTYTNTARIVTSSLNDGALNASTESLQSKDASVNVAAVTPTVTKSVDKTTVEAGGQVTYTITATVPANINLYNAVVTDPLPGGTSVTGTATCTIDGSATGCSPLASSTTGTTPNTTTTVGWSFGNIASSSTGHTVSITVPVQLSTSAANTTTRGTALLNTTKLSWNSSDKGNASSVGGTYDANAPSNQVSSTVTTPNVTIGMGVSTPTPQPGDVFTYTVTPTNAATAGASTAYDTVLTVAVPANVVVDPSTLPAGATLTGNDPTTGGGTITFAPVTIAPGAAVALTYRASLAPSTSLTSNTKLTSTASVASYNSIEGSGVAYKPAAGTVAASAIVTPSLPIVSLTKAAGSGTLAYVGQPFPWKVTIANTGATATTLRVTDTLPKNWTFVAGSATYSNAGGTATALADPTVTTAAGVQTLVWPTADFTGIASGATSVLTYRAVPATDATTDAGVGPTHLHTNTVSATVTDSTGATADADRSYVGPNASATAEIASADIAIAKTADQALVAGTTVSAWKLAVSNAGAESAVGPFTVTDTPQNLPADVTITGASGTGWTCTTPTTTGAFTCARAASTDTLASGASFPVISVTAATSSNAPVENVTNTATVTAATFDPKISDNTSTSTVSTVQRADVAITKTVGAVHAGQAVTWTVGVSNNGPSTARHDVVVTDAVPTGVTGVTGSGTGWTCTTASDTVTCTLTGDLAADAAAGQITLTGTVGTGYTGTLANTATVTSPTLDPTPSNNSATVTGSTDVGTSLSVAKTLVSNTLEPGSNGQFRVAVTNTGSADATHVVVTDPLPSGLTFVSGAVDTGTPGAWTCSATGTPQTVTCDLTGSLSAVAGSTTSAVLITVVVPADLTGPVTNVASAVADNAPSVSGSWSNSSAPRTVINLTKTHAAGAIFSGTSVDYTLTATNVGPSVAPSGTEIVDTLPVGLTPTSASGRGWTCTIDAQVVTCDSSATATVGAAFSAVTVSASTAAGLAAQTLVNQATVTGPADPSTGTASDPTVITTSAALHVTKTRTSSAQVVAGTQATYDVTVTNDGSSDASAVSLADVVPAGMTVVSMTGDGWTCDRADCTIADLAPGTTTVHVTADVASSVAEGTATDPTVLTNTANLGWSDSQGGHTGTSTADVTVVARDSVSLTVTPVDASGNAITSATAGTSLDWNLVATNDGPSDAVGPVTITATLPAGIGYTNSNAGWTCTVDATNAQIVRCVLDGGVGLAAGATAPGLVLTTQIASNDVDPSENLTAVVSTSTINTSTNSLDSAPASGTIDLGEIDDLSLGMVHSAAGHIGSALPFTLAVKNAGPSDARGVVVTDVIPAGLTYVGNDGSDSAWTCEAGTPTDAGTPVTCTLTGDLAAGATAPTLVLDTTVTSAAFPGVTNTASVSSTTSDTVAANNDADDPITVAALSALSITKTHTGSAVRGSTLVYTLAVTNAGPTADPGPVTVTDALPTGLSYVSSSGGGAAAGVGATGSAAAADATCTPTGTTVSCVLAGDVAVGQTRTIELTTRVASDAPSSILNTASVASPTEQDRTGTVAATAMTASNEVGVTSAPVTGIALAFTGSNGVYAAIVAGFLALAGGVALTLVGREQRPGRRH